MSKKVKENKFTNTKTFQVVLCFLIAILIYGIVVMVVNYKNYTNVNLKVNSNAMFSITDLSVRNVLYGDLESVVVTEFGRPKKIEKFNNKKQKYKKYKYDGLNLTFKEENDSYKLMKLECTSKDYMVSRDIRVGDNINEVMNKFLVSNNDEEYLYGNYTEEAFRSKSVKDSIFYGKRDSKIIYYLYTNGPYKKGYATWNDDIAQLTFKISRGKIRKIEWMYGPVVED